MIFNTPSANSIVAIIFLGLTLGGCATSPSTTSDSNRVSLGVQLVRVPATVTRSVTRTEAPAWQSELGDPDDFEGDEPEEIAEMMASDTPPVTKIIVRESKPDPRSIFHDGDVDAESGDL